MKETKEEVIGVVFSKLKPERTEVFADVGCGSGAVSRFFSRYVSKVYAVDQDPRAVEAARRTLRNAGNVEVVLSSGLDFLKDRRYGYDVVFFGGTKGIEKMLGVAAVRAKRVAVNAARLEVAANVVRRMRELGIFREALAVNVARGYELAGGTAFKPLNPVFVIYGECDALRRGAGSGR